MQLQSWLGESGSVLGVSQQTLLAGFLLGSALLVIGVPATIRLMRSRGVRLPALRSKSRNEPAPTAAARLQDVSRTRDERRHLEQLSLEVRQLTKLCISEINDRAESLESLLVRAERVAERMERAAPGGAGPGMDAGAPEIGVRRVEPKAPPRVIPEEVDPTRAQILALAGEGKSALEIAGELEEHVGKVELILALGR